MSFKEKIFSFASLGLLIILLPPGGFSAWTWVEGLRWLYLFLISFFVVIILTPFTASFAYKINAIDYPDKRKIHNEPKPRIGGLAVYLAFMFTILRNHQFSMEIVGVMIAGTIIFMLGFIDDWKGMSAMSRLFWQLIASVIVVSFGLYLSFPLKLPYGKLISWTLSILWLIGILNAFNFLDGIDGLVSSMGAICSLLFLVLVWNTNQYPVSFLSAALSGACIGFLMFNWHPAKIFLGDCGSTLIGFLLGCLAIYGGWADNNPMVALSTPVLILGIPIFDIIYTTISRIKNGEVRDIRQWLEYTGKDHFHHRLMNLGFSVKNTVGFIILLNLCLGLGSWTMHYTSSTIGTIFLLVQSIIIFIIVVILMLIGRRSMKDESEG